MIFTTLLPGAAGHRCVCVCVCVCECVCVYFNSSNIYYMTLRVIWGSNVWHGSLTWDTTHFMYIYIWYLYARIHICMYIYISRRESSSVQITSSAWQWVKRPFSTIPKQAVCCGVLQCDAVCYSVLQCVAVCCSVLQCVAVCCIMLQCAALCCIVLHCAASCCSVLQHLVGFESLKRCCVLQCVAVRCSIFIFQS